MAPSPSASLPERPYPGIVGGLLLAAALALAGCSTTPPRSRPTPPPPPPSTTQLPDGNWFALLRADHAQEIVIFALGLLDTGYRFGGANPDAGLDCSGMVSYVVEQVSGQKLPHNAAQIAGRTRPVAAEAIRPGDLVFFNTLGRSFSHMGIYVGDGRFIHAPNSRGKVRVDRLDNRYFAQRFEGARTMLPRS